MASVLMHVADRLFNTPLLIEPTKLATIAWVLRDRVSTGGNLEMAELEEIDASRFVGTRRRNDRPYAMTRAAGGVAIIPVLGTLVNRGAWIDASSGLTSYEGLDAQFRDALADPEVHAIVMDINSPGGEATGMFQLADTIRQVRNAKPISAVVNDVAASAAYGLAAQANEIVVSPTSVVGSIGVLQLHLDRSGEMAKMGVNPTFIFAGSRKIDGHPFAPLSDDVKSRLQNDVNTFYERFIETVVAGRGRRLSAEQARATEADTFIGQEAITLGLADRVASLETVMAERARRTTRPSQERRMSTMDVTATHTQAQVDAAAAAARAEGRAEGVKEGSTAERTRIAAVMALPEAAERTDMALTMALETDMAPAAIGKVLAKAPAAAAPVKEEPKAPGIADRQAGRTEAGPAGDPTGATPGSTNGVWGPIVEKRQQQYAANQEKARRT